MSMMSEVEVVDWAGRRCRTEKEIQATTVTQSSHVPPAWLSGLSVQQEPASRQSVTYRLSVLYPPAAGAPPPTTRARPPGCRTVFIGGLPELAGEEEVLDVFDQCGEVVQCRMSKKNFCHIRYAAEFCVDNALCLSGWRMKLGNSSDAAKTGRLHVDYAVARDDQYEFECGQRAAERAARHLASAAARPPSPPAPPNYTDHEAASLTEQIKAAGVAAGWAGPVATLLVWLERGDCNKRNAHCFYSLIQAVSGHVRRLVGEQAEQEVELARQQAAAREKLGALAVQCKYQPHTRTRWAGSAGKSFQ